MTDGILLLDKPQGISSSAAVQRVRHALGRIKAGHTGSLDPLATGMLPICLGEATKVAGYLLEGDKGYRFTARFGSRTTTGDLEGDVAERCEVPSDLGAALTAVLPRFTGPLMQVPPMYSAIKQAGQPLYKLARQGIEVPREARQVEIRSLVLTGVEGQDAHFELRCSKGTYVRTLAEDLARAVGSCAHLVMLRREFAAPFEGQPLTTLAQVLESPGTLTLLPPDAALAGLASLTLGLEGEIRLRQGQAQVIAGPTAGGLLRLYGQGGRFLGIGEAAPSGILKPVRLFNLPGTIPT